MIYSPLEQVAGCETANAAGSHAAFSYGVLIISSPARCIGSRRDMASRSFFIVKDSISQKSHKLTRKKHNSDTITD